MEYISQAKCLVWYLWAMFLGSVTWQSVEVLSSDIQGGTFQRKLLNDGNTLVNTSAGPDTGTNSGTWPYLLAALITMLTVSLLILIVVKCQLFQRYLISYRHMLLPEGDTVSQYDPDVGFTPQNVAERVQPRRVNMDDDDDGFIEDTYIQAVERERVGRQREQQRHMEDDESDDDELDLGPWTIG